jgi:nucleoside-diphosphate-sugar epimerase
MVIGSGMLARQFSFYSDNPDVVIFASGVSHSGEKNPQAFLREQTLLETAIELNKNLVYFSTTSIEDALVNESPYVHHKISMENLIRNSAKKYHIFRLSQVLGHGGNPNTIINSIRNKILNDETINIYAKSTRNIISSDDIKNIISLLITADRFSNKTINVASPWDMPIADIVSLLAKHLQKKPNTQLQNIGHPISTNILEILDLSYNFGAATGAQYLGKIFQRHLLRRAI